MTATTYLEWEDQATGANNNTWGDVTDANLTIFEQAIARLGTISTTGGTTTLTSSQNRYPVLKITGVLASNAIIQVRTAEKNWHVVNATTGNFSVTVKTSGGTGKTVPRGRAVFLYCDGTNVEQVRRPEIPVAQAAGTVDAITATFEPATVSGELQDGTMFLVEAAGANTSTTPTFNPDSTGALTITKNGGQALLAGDIRAAGHKLMLCYDASSTRYELLNPASPNDVSPAGTPAQGDVLYYGASAWTRLTAGTSGQYLKTQGAGANPLWADLPSTVTVPTGAVMPFAGPAAPSGYLLCDGSSVSRTSYAALFAAISTNATVTITIASPGVVSWTGHGLAAGDPVTFTTTGALPTGITAGTTYYVISAGLTANSFQLAATKGGAAINTTGSQSGVHTVFYVPHGAASTTNFNLPDLRGRVVAGKDNMSGAAASRLTSGGSGLDGTTLGNAGGSETHTLTTAQIPSHLHSITTRTGTGGNTGIIHSTGLGSPNSDNTDTAGSDGAHNNTQPTAIMNYIIKT